MRERDKQIRLAGCFAIAEGILPFSILAYKGFRKVMASDYVVLGEFPNTFMEICQADSVKYLELCDKYFIGWMRKQAPGRAQNPLAGLHF